MFLHYVSLILVCVEKEGMCHNKVMVIVIISLQSVISCSIKDNDNVWHVTDHIHYH